MLPKPKFIRCLQVKSSRGDIGTLHHFRYVLYELDCPVIVWIFGFKWENFSFVQSRSTLPRLFENMVRIWAIPSPHIF